MVNRDSFQPSKELSCFWLALKAESLRLSSSLKFPPEQISVKHTLERISVLSLSAMVACDSSICNFHFFGGSSKMAVSLGRHSEVSVNCVKIEVWVFISLYRQAH